MTADIKAVIMLRFFKVLLIIAAFIMPVLLTDTVAMAQKSLPRGGKVYVHLVNNDEHTGDVKEELIRQLQQWGYWTVVFSKDDADMILDLNVQTHRGMTAWSWGGVTVKASATLEDISGETVWRSREYKANPNGTNGFNTARATAGKIVSELQKRFK